MKLWQKNSDNQTSAIQKKIEEFTVGNDKHWDLYLAEADIKGSRAHGQMLLSIGILTQEEFGKLNDGLNEILEAIKCGEFIIEEGVEDIHSQIEILLTRSHGEVGQKIHSGRSRNDQSLLDIKLYLKQELSGIANKTALLFDAFLALSEEHKSNLMPGYTHMQLAMPSSFGLWFAAYAESLSDDLELLIAAFNVVNKNPLGSGAGYGSSFPINRQLTTELLGFQSMNYNVMYAQMTRGKTEKITSMALAGVAATLSKFSMDACLYMNQNFGFITFPSEFTTGSSIMPHKKNPDVFELIRAKCNRIQALPNELTLLINNLVSGYHRDMQLTKECLFPAIIELNNCMDILAMMLENIHVKTNLLEDIKYQKLYTVETVNNLVLAGVPFREAYKQVGQQVEENDFSANTELFHVHEGSIGNLCNDKIKENFYSRLEKFRSG